MVDTLGSTIATQDSLAGPFGLTRALDVATVIETAGGKRIEIGETVDWSVQYAPVLQWSPGGPAVAGILTASGDWDVSVGARSGAGFGVDHRAAHPAPDCESRITAGTVVAAFVEGDQSASISVQWTGCNDSEVTVALNGEWSESCRPRSHQAGTG